MPKQLTKTLGDFNVSTDILRQGFASLAGNKPELNDLGIIFEVGLTDLSLFPNIKLSDSATYMDYLEKWIKGYADATANPPSRRKASPKGSCSDPAIQTIVQIAMNTDETFAARMAAYHNAFYHNYIRKSRFTFFYHLMKGRTKRIFFSRCNIYMNIDQFPVVMPGYKFCQPRNLCLKTLKLIHSVRTHTSIDDNMFHRLICISRNHSHFARHNILSFLR